MKTVVFFRFSLTREIFSGNIYKKIKENSNESELTFKKRYVHVLQTYLFVTVISQDAQL